MKEKRQKEIGIPNRLAKYALSLYTDAGLNLVSRRDRQGRCICLDVPYHLNDLRFRGFRLIKQGRTVVAQLVGPKTLACALTKDQREEIYRLFAKIDEALSRRREAERHCPVICT